MKKKFTGIVLGALVMCTSLLTGCGLMGVDNDKYYNSVVSSIKQNGEVVAEITAKDLLNGYQNIGYQYENFYGMSKKEAVNETLKALQDRKIMVLEAEAHFDIDRTGKNLSSLEKSYLWETTVNSLQDNLDSYYQDIVGEQEEKKEETEEVKFESYTKTAKLVLDENGDYVIKVIDKNNGLMDGYSSLYGEKDYNNEQDRALIFDNLKENLTGKYVDAFNRYYKDLQFAEKGMGLSTQEKSVFEREIDRIYLQTYENLIIEKYNEHITSWGCVGLKECIVEEGDTKNDISSIGVQDILDLYASKVRTDYTTYEVESSSTYNDDVQKSLTDTYYFKQGAENTKFFTVANILFNKSKTVEGKYDLIVRNDDSTGVYVEEKAVQVSKSEIEGFIANKIENVLKSAQNTNDLEVIGDQIKECVFKYSQDPGSLSATSNYVIGVDNQGKAVSSFVESFNEAGLKLYKNENRKFGDIAIAESEYGIHVLIYTGACENLFQGINGSFTLTNDQQEGQLSAIQVLAQTRVSPMLDKTIFDVLFDELNALYVNTPSYVQQANAELIRTDYQITNYRDRIPESLK